MSRADDLVREAGLQAREAFARHDPVAWELARVELQRRRMLSEARREREAVRS